MSLFNSYLGVLEHLLMQMLVNLSLEDALGT